MHLMWNKHMLVILFLALPVQPDEENVENPTNNCVCKDKSLCAAIKVGPRQEVYGFSTAKSNWRNYDWDKITTIAVFGEWDKQLVCHAHSNVSNVRLVLKVDCPVAKLVDVNYRKEIISETIATAKSYFADGANIDIEQPVERGSAEEKALTLFSKEMTEEFHSQIPGSQVTFDVAWSPDCIDSRCYNYTSLAEVTDFLIVMSYDVRSQIYGECIAGPNSSNKTTFEGIEKYLQLGIDANKLVLGLPWYGYNFPCIKSTGNTCEIKKVPFRGVNCSAAAGRQYCYSSIMSKYLPQAIGGRQFDQASQSPFFTYEDLEDHSMHQVWYDDPESLAVKYNHGIKNLGLRGLALFHVDCLNYTDTAQAKEETKKMWGAVLEHQQI